MAASNGLSSLRTIFDEQQGQFVTHPNGQNTHFIVNSYVDPWLPESKKQVILINPGYARHAAFWYHWIPILARKYVVIRRDTRGHGKSSSPNRINAWSETKGIYEHNYNYGIDTIVEEMVDLLNQLGIKKLHFIGESTSGQLGHALAAKHPERVMSLITMSTPTHLPEDKTTFLAMGQSSWPEALIKLGSSGWARALSSQPGTSPMDISPEYSAWWLQQASANSSVGLAGYAEFLSGLDSRQFLSQIKCPVLILAPMHSKATPMSQSQYTADHIQNSKLVPIDTQGHEIYVEAVEQCSREVLQFLAQFE